MKGLYTKLIGWGKRGWKWYCSYNAEVQTSRQCGGYRQRLWLEWGPCWAVAATTSWWTESTARAGKNSRRTTTMFYFRKLFWQQCQTELLSSEGWKSDWTLGNSCSEGTAVIQTKSDGDWLSGDSERGMTSEKLGNDHSLKVSIRKVRRLQN